MNSRLASLLLFAMPLAAAIDGTVINGTTGKPSADTAVSLIEPSQSGMQPLAETKSDAAGKFSFTQSPKGPAFIQAAFEGATYMKMVMPGAPSTGIQVEVFNSTQKEVAKVAQHMILLQPGADALSVTETLLYQGDPKLTYNNGSNGSIRFYVPPEARNDVKATIGFDMPGGSSIPIERQVDKAKQPNVYKIDYPIKPGETRVDITYTLPAANPAVFSDKILHAEGKTRLVVPNGVTAKGDNLQEIGKEPQTQATIYDLNGQALKVELTGTGSLQPAAGDSTEDTGQPTITEAPPHIYNKMYWILGLAFGILGLGTYLLLTREMPAPSARK